MNIYKPRYKIAFASKSKVWIYKDSRLRSFFSIRGKKLIRRGLFKRYFLVLNNMKWTVARRYIRPYMRKRKPFKKKQRYTTAFYNKQQIRHFYGKFKESFFRNLYKSHVSKINIKTKAFVSVLERRIDMFLFRTRLIPTFYAANQLVYHQGIEIDGLLQKSPNTLMCSGSALNFESKFWTTFSSLLQDRIFFRTFGRFLWHKRRFTKLKKKFWHLKNKFKSKNRNSRKKIVFVLYKKLNVIIKKFSFLNSYLKIFSVKSSLKLKSLLSLFPLLEIKKDLIFSARFNYFWISLNIFREEHLLLYKNKKEIKMFLSCNRNKKKLKIKSSLKLIQILSKITSFYLNIASLFYKIRIWELRLDFFFGQEKFKQLLLKTDPENKTLLLLIKSRNKTDVSLFNQNVSVLKKSFELLQNKLCILFEAFIRRRLRVRRWFFLSNFSKKKSVLTLRKSSLYYFMIYRKKKKRRFAAVPRLKQIHWYVPSYTYFDFNMILTYLLHNPTKKEIYYSFKFSLLQIQAFYRSRGL